MSRGLRAYNERRKRAAKARTIVYDKPFKAVVCLKKNNDVIETQRFKKYDDALTYCKAYDEDTFVTWVE